MSLLIHIGLLLACVFAVILSVGRETAKRTDRWYAGTRVPRLDHECNVYDDSEDHAERVCALYHADLELRAAAERVGA